MYVYVNTTEAALQQNFTKLSEIQERIRNGTGEKTLLHVYVWWINVASYHAVTQKPSLFLRSCSLSLTGTKGRRLMPPTPS